jgi:hypothetical protein
VLDGGRRLAAAFSGGAGDVTLDSIIVQNYASVAGRPSSQSHQRLAGAQRFGPA